MDFYPKYLKYKKKYLDLKEQIGGDDCTNYVTKRNEGKYKIFSSITCDIISKLKKVKSDDPDIEKEVRKSEHDYLFSILNVFIDDIYSKIGDKKEGGKKIEQLNDFLKTINKNYYINKDGNFINTFQDIYRIISASNNKTQLKKVFMDNDPNELFKYMKKNGISDIASAILQMP
jgi:hypothetical protein